MPPGEPDERLDVVTTAALAVPVLSAAGTRRIAAFLAASQPGEGGFRDRGGRSDLYYTVFGLSGFAALGRPVPQPERVTAFLDGIRHLNTLSFVDLVSLVRCRRLAGIVEMPEWRSAVQEALNRYRSRDGAFSHEHREAPQGTLYAVYLADQCYRDLDLARDDLRPHTMELIRLLRTPDGGFSNHAGASQGVATATASAVTLLIREDGKRSDTVRSACAFLESLWCEGGGCRAVPEATGADLLSTASALYALSLCRQPVSEAMLTSTSAFVEQLWSDEGGFRGTPADPVPDVEYTFYALLALGSVSVLRGTY